MKNEVKSYPIQIDKYGNLCAARMDARSTRVVELSDYEEQAATAEKDGE